MMKTITYEGDGLSVVIEMGKPTVSTGLVADVLKTLLLPSAQTGFAKQQIETFSDVIRYTRSVIGYALVLPTWNSNITDYLAVWQAWRDMPEDLAAPWVDAMLEIRDGGSPLVSRSDPKTSESSEQLLNNLQKTEPNQAVSPMTN